MRKAAEIPEEKGDREGAFSLARISSHTQATQPTHPSPPPSKHRASTGSTEQSSSQSAQCTQKEGTAAGGGGPPIRLCAPCQPAVAEEECEAILRPNHPCEPCPSSPPRLYHHPLGHYCCQRITQHIRSRHAIAQLSTCLRPYRFASSTRCVLPSISCDNAQLWRCILSLLHTLHTLPFNARPFQTRRLRPQKPSLLLSFSPSEEGLVFVSSRPSRLVAHFISAMRLCHKGRLTALTALSGNVSRDHATAAA